MDKFQQDQELRRQNLTKKTEIELAEIYQQSLAEIRIELYKYAERQGDVPYYKQTRAGELMELEKKIINVINGQFPKIRNLVRDFGVYAYEMDYLQPFYETLERYGISVAVPALALKQAERVVDLPVAGVRLSQRLYKDRNKLANQVTRELATGAMQGKSVYKVAQAIENVSGVSYRNAVRIVRTEGTRISGTATQDGLRDLQEAGQHYGIQTMKTWVSAHDSRTRASHASLDGQTVSIDGYFESISGARAKHPGGFGVASEDINCRCTIVSEVKLNGKTAQEINEEHWETHGGFDEWFKQQQST